MKRADSPWWAAGYTAQWWEGLTKYQRTSFLDALDPAELESFFRDWRIWARDNQLTPEGIWETWLLLMGRGTGKTRTAVEAIKDDVRAGRASRIALVGQGDADIREVMLEGESGFLSTADSDFRPTYQPSVGSGRLVWPNGAIGFTYSAADPESLRGPQFDLGWFDEPMAVPAEARQKTVSNLRFGLRLGRHPRMIFSTTPKPHRWLTDEIQKAARFAHLPMEQRRYVLTKGSTLENRANLPASFFRAIMDDYGTSTLGKQEIYAEIIGTEEGALWTPQLLDQQRLLCPETLDAKELPGEWPSQLLKAFADTCDRIVVSVDPNLSATSKIAHAAGIVVMGIRGGIIYVLADRTTKGGPHQWARAAVRAAIEFGADEIVAEKNQGGEMVRIVLRAAIAEFPDVSTIPVHLVHASKGKQARAEPVSTAYERGQVYHLGPVGNTDNPGPLFLLESQMCSLHDAFDPTGEDFDRCDAMVWGATRLGVRNRARFSAGRSLGGFLTFQDFGNGSTHH
jgi:phage terminase large subunit-like protein